jgi:hypothetical protein
MNRMLFYVVYLDMECVCICSVSGNTKPGYQSFHFSMFEILVCPVGIFLLLSCLLHSKCWCF